MPETMWNWEDSLKAAIQVGISFSEYQEMLPYELNLFLEVYNARMEAEQQEKVILVWLGEYYTRIKKLPNLKKALQEFFGDTKKTMSDDEMLDIAKKLNAQFGGVFIEDGLNERKKSEIDPLQDS